ncbi:MAG: hypothetical protein MUF87_04830 [Anaerolineae bacterium]|jgi:hypothetical protein|nr:hypothetical protein [Anaerolineae bacterium]
MRKLLLVVLMLCLSGLLLADNHSETVFCGDLAAEDCDILVASSEAMAGLTGASAEFMLNLNVAGMPGEMSELALDVTGSGTYSGVDMMAMGAMAQDMDMMSAMTAAGEAIAAFNGELTLTLSLPAELAGAMGPDAPESITLDLRLVEGVGYINFDTLSGLGLPAELSGWGGLDLVSSLQQLAPMLGDMGDMGGMDTPEMSEEDMMAMTEGMTITRMEDEDGAAVFMSTLDAAALFSNPTVRDAFLSQLEAQGMTGTDGEAIFDAFAENPDAFTFNMFTVIDLETFYVRTSSFEMSMDLGTLMAATGEETEGMENATFAMMGQLSYVAYNDVPTIEAPEGAPVVTLNELFMALSSMSAPQP